MNIETMFDNLGNMPVWAQVLLTMLFLFGSGGGIGSMIFNYLKSANDSKHKERLELVENKQITIQNEQLRIQSEAAQSAADRLNTQKLIEVIAASNDRWQRVFDNSSERKHQDETRLIVTLDKLDSTIDHSARITEEMANGLALQIGHVATDVKTFRVDNEKTEAFIRASVDATNRNIDSVLEAAVAVRDRVIPLIDNLEKKLINLENCGEMKTILLEIKVLLDTPPRPATADNATLPAPETWNEETETTAIIPPKKLADDDNNPLLNTA
jgi:hypothetical protein